MASLILNNVYLNPLTNPRISGMIINLILSIGAALAALFIGLLLRRTLVKRLKKTVLDNWILQTLGALVVALALLLGIVSGLAIWNNGLLSGILTTILPSNNKSATVSWLNSLFWTIIIIALGIGAARTIKALTIRGLGENHIDINTRTLIGRIFYITTLIIASLMVLNTWNVGIGVPVAVVGALAVASTVAFQDILKNLVAGFYILLERPFYIGDQISMTNGMITYIGKVEDIQLRVTKLRLVSGEEVAIPNMLIFANAVINNTFYGERRAVITITLPADEFIPEQTQEQLLNVLKEVDEVMSKPEPQIIFSGYTEGKATLIARFWVASGQNIDISRVVYKLHEAMPQADLSIKEPVGSV